jgi:hypothetical protein
MLRSRNKENPVEFRERIVEEGLPVDKLALQLTENVRFMA